MLILFLLFTFLAAITYFQINLFPLWRKKILNGNPQLPPGPWGFPLVGHIPMLGSDAHNTLTKWKGIHGPIYSIRLGTTPVVVITDSKILKQSFLNDALSGRPRIQMFDTVVQRKGLLFTDGDSQFEQRKFTITTLKGFGFGSHAMESRMQEDLSTFLEQVKHNLGKPIQVKHFFKLPIVNSLWDLLMGKRFDEKDPSLANIYEILDSTLSTKSSFAKLSVYAPWFGRWFGFFGYNNSLQKLQAFYTEIDKLINYYQKSHIPGEPNGFTGAYLDKVNETLNPRSSFHSSAKMHPITTGDIVMSSIATITTALDWLLVHLIRNPQVQEKLQEEIDRVVGDSRTPTLNDRINMPYAVAVVNEVLRKSASVGLSRRAVEDVVFQGYFIPKDTMIMKIPEACNNDPKVWDEPEKFEPLRFLDANGRLKKTSLLPFGAGKRSCFGASHTLDLMFLVTTGFFQTFTISCGGNYPSAEVQFDFVNTPKPFEMIFNFRRTER